MAKHGRKRRFHPLILFCAVVVFYAGLFSAWDFYHQWIAAIRLDTLKSAYYHYEFIDIRLRTRDLDLLGRWQTSPPRAVVMRDGEPVTTIAHLKEVELIWDPKREAFIGKWPCPWNAPAGDYELAIEDIGDLKSRLRASTFKIQYRKPKPAPKRFVVMTMENARPFTTMKVKTPDGQMKDWRGLLDWVQFVEADAFWILAGETPGEKPGEVWVSYNLPLIPEIAQECRKRRIQFGVYAMNYLTVSKTRLDRYQYALDVDQGRPVLTRAISLLDPQRPKDVIALLKRFKDLPGVDYLGLDYIRNALGGYEMAETFFNEMTGVRPPADWDKLSRDEKIVWFARKKIMRRDMDFIEAWEWWRAHRAALIVKQIKEGLGSEKGLWAFTLTWDKGWHHGQDPVMMNDAGVDIDSLMLYEADQVQFNQMMKDWHDYVRRGDVQLAVGDVLDWPLHQYSPLGPQDFYNRVMRASEYIYQDGPASGIFFHDLARGLWGRLGPYGTRQWMEAARSAARHFREMKDLAPSAPVPIQAGPVRKKDLRGPAHNKVPFKPIQ